MWHSCVSLGDHRVRLAADDCADQVLANPVLLCLCCCPGCAAGLNFLSVYAALSLAYHTHNSPGALVVAAAAVGLGIFKVWLQTLVN
jgi:hypothetical protein